MQRVIDLTSTDRGQEPAMFKILELKGTQSTPAAEVGPGFATHQAALVAVRRHLKTFNVSGHNPEGNYWWARDAEGLRKCWISSPNEASAI
jgi:hypothetical protein